MKHAHNYIGTQIKCNIAGQTLLGDVKDAYRQTNGDIHLIVRHFNGEPWPFDPNADRVTVLDVEPVPVGPHAATLHRPSPPPFK
jgi:hypothetical protein